MLICYVQKTLRALLAALPLAVLAVVPAIAQVPVGYVQVSGNYVGGQTSPEANGTIYFAPVNNSGVPIGYRIGQGSGATVTASWTSSAITGCTVTAGGGSYTSGATAVISSANGSGGVLALTVASGVVTGCSVTSGGAYTAAPSVVVAGYGQATQSTLQAQVTSGAFSLLVPDTAMTSPVNVCFSVTVIDNVSGNSILGPGYTCVQPAGSGSAVTGTQPWCTASTTSVGGACNFDAYPPNLAALALTQTGPAPTIAGATATPLSYGSSPTANVSGTNPYTINLGIPAGAPGANGATGPPATFLGAWSSSTAYTTGQTISYGGSSFVALAASTNVTPPATCTSNASWGILACEGAGGSAALNNAIVGTGSGSTDAGSPPLLQAQPSGAAAIPMAGSNSLGIPLNTYAILMLGNSTFAGKEPQWVAGFCSAVQPGNLLAGGVCRQLSYISCTSGDVCTANVDNHDGFFQVNNWYSGGGSTSTCAFDGPYLLTAVTASTITFNGATSDSNCSSVISANSNFMTDIVNKFGSDGGVFSQIYTGTGNFAYPNLLTVATAQKALGKIPVLLTLTNSLNDARQFLTSVAVTGCPGSGSVAGIVCDESALIANFTGLNPQSPIILAEEEAPLQGHGAGSQYVCPEGTAHAGGCSANSTAAATITSGAITAPGTETSTSFYIASNVATVNVSSNSFTVGEYVPLASFTTATYFNGITVQITAVSSASYSFNTWHANVGSSGSPTTDTTGVATGTNAVTLSFCPLSIWGGVGAPTNVLAPDGATPYGMVLDTAGSGVQETVPLYNITPSGSTCTVSIANANAHGASAPMQATEATAAIQTGVTLHYAYLAILGKFRNVIGFPTQTVLTGLTSQVYNSTNNGCYADQLHIPACAAQEAQMIVNEISPVTNTPNETLKGPREILTPIAVPINLAGMLNTASIPYAPSIDPSFSAQIASNIRYANVVNGGNYNQLESGTLAYPLGSEDGFFFRNLLKGTLLPSSMTPIQIQLRYPQGSATWNPIAGFDEICLAGVGCYSPSTFTMSDPSTISLNLNVNSNPWIAYAATVSQTSGLQIAVQRPVMADAQYSLPYYLNPQYSQVGIGTVVANTTGSPSTFTLSLYNLGSGLLGNASDMNLGSGDVVVVRGVGATTLASTVTCAPAGGNTSNLLCTDTAGTSYATWTAGTIMDVYVKNRGQSLELAANMVGPQPITVSTTVFAPSYPFACGRARVFGSVTGNSYICLENVPVNGAANPISLMTLDCPTSASSGGCGTDLSPGKYTKVSLVLAGGTASASGCSLTSLVGGASAGQFASGTAGTCTVTITPGITAPHGFFCSAHDITTPADTLPQSASSTTTCTVSGTTASGDTVIFSVDKAY